jgi:hypothetical protein
VASIVTSNRMLSPATPVYRVALTGPALSAAVLAVTVRASVSGLN